MAYGLVVDGEIVAYSGFPNEDLGYVELPDGGALGWGYYGDPPVLIEPPSFYHYWQSTQFVVNQTLFTPALLVELRNYRDQKMATEVSYSGDTTISTIANNESITALSRVCSGITVMDTDNGNINWKNADGEYNPNPASYADVQGLFKECHKHEQWLRKAEKAVLDKHMVTPYEFIQDAKDDFDAELTGV